jgi:hypothetical protein
MTTSTAMKFLGELSRALLGRATSYRIYEAHQRALGYPDQLAMHQEFRGRRPDLADPARFSDKITWLKLHDKNPLFPILTDKVRVRDWIAARVGRDRLVPAVGVFERAEELRRAELPSRFVAKVNFGTGHNVFVWDRDAMDLEAIIAQLDGWLREPQPFALMEWYHHHISPRILVEHLMVDANGTVPYDYKCLVFHGRLEIIYCVRNRFSVKTIAYYRREWQPIDLHAEERERFYTDPPPLLEEMIELAEALGRPFPFMRVDIYCHEGRAYVGELTPHPNSGMGVLEPSSYDLEFGKLLNLTSLKGWPGK